MNLASLQAITWSTVTAAVGSALLLASFGGELLPDGTHGARSAPARVDKAMRVSLPAGATAAAIASPAVVRTAEAAPQR